MFAEMPAGAAVAATLRIAADMKEGTVVTVLPDRGDCYLSTVLFRPMCADCPPNLPADTPPQ